MTRRSQQLHMGSAHFDPDLAGGWTFGILAKKGAGKTYTGRVMAEEMWDAGIPFAALDPTGAWWGLREEGATPSSGIPVVIFGGEHADVPLEPTAGQVVADLLVVERVPMVLDLSGFGTRTAERRFAKDFLERVYRRNKDLLHLFVDEADLFAPQKPASGDQPLLGVMENLVRRGRIKGIGCTLITQRSAVLNKDVLTQIDVLCAMRIVSPQDRAAIGEWIKGHDLQDRGKEVLDSLASLKNGEAWWWAPELDMLQRGMVRTAKTFDSSGTPTRMREARSQSRTRADVDLSAIEASIGATIERAKAEDPKELQKRIRELERQVQHAEEMRVGYERRLAEKITEPVEVPALPIGLLAELGETHASARDVESRLSGLRDQLKGIIEEDFPTQTARSASATAMPLGKAPTVSLGSPSERAQGKGPPRRQGAGPAPVPIAQTHEYALPNRPGMNGDEPQLKAGARRILEELARVHPLRLTRNQVGLATGMKITGGTFNTYWSTLKRAGYLDEQGGDVGITGEGLERAGVVPSTTPRSTEEMIALWGSKLKRGAREMLNVLVEIYPNSFSREVLGEQLDMAASGGTFNTYLSTLTRNGLVEKVDGSDVRAHPNLFIGA